MGIWMSDLVYGLRTMMKRPGFTLAIVITLALGVGANTAIFSAINAVLLRPLPFKDPQGLMMIYRMNPPGARTKDDTQPWSYSKFKILREANESFDQVASFSKKEFSLIGNDDATRVVGEYVSASYFPVLGVNAMSGRVFLPEEDQVPKTDAVILIGNGLWKSRFSSDPALVGKTVNVNGIPLTVVGIMPQDFKGLSGEADLWVPNMMAPALLSGDQLTQPFVHWMDVFGRLKPGVTTAQAEAEMPAVVATIKERIPGPPGLQGGDIKLVPLHESKVDPAIKKAFLILFIAVGFVLLISCVNIANLLLARAFSRRKEIAIRLALGATRRHVIRLLLVESLLLGLCGGLVGLLIAYWGIELLNLIKPANNPAEWARNFQILNFNKLGLDGWVLAFNFAIALASGLLFGLMPAMQSSSFDINSSLKEVALGPSENMGRGRRIGPRGFLVITEIALSFVLLVGAGLMIKSFERIQETRIGFDPDNLLALKFDISKYDQNAARNFYEQLLNRVMAVPGVESASFSRSLPLLSNSGATELTVEGHGPAAPGTGPSIGYQLVGPGYFETMRIPIQRGRAFTPHDAGNIGRVAVINETAARELWPDEDPLGKRVRLALGWKPDDWAEIVGIVGDVKYNNIEKPVTPDIYLSYLQDSQRPPFLILRSSNDPTTLVSSVRQEVLALDRALPVYNVKTLNQIVDEARSKTRLSAVLLTIFGAIALILSAIGIYGVMSYIVSSRTREIGIRMAFGARQADILKLILSEGVVLIGVGLFAGVLIAIALTRVLASQLFNVSSTDPVTFIAIWLVLMGVALMACYIPARGATKVDPMIALRQ